MFRMVLREHWAVDASLNTGKMPISPTAPTGFVSVTGPGRNYLFAAAAVWELQLGQRYLYYILMDADAEVAIGEIMGSRSCAVDSPVNHRLWMGLKHQIMDVLFWETCWVFQVGFQSSMTLLIGNDQKPWTAGKPVPFTNHDVMEMRIYTTYMAKSRGFVDGENGYFTNKKGQTKKKT